MTAQTFPEVRHELRRASWWARTWSLALLWRERANPSIGAPYVERTRSQLRERPPGRVVLRPSRCVLSPILSWRVHRHEKAAWARLEELTR